jgi:hypothetical protein
MPDAGREVELETERKEVGRALSQLSVFGWALSLVSIRCLPGFRVPRYSPRMTDRYECPTRIEDFVSEQGYRDEESLRSSVTVA